LDRTASATIERFLGFSPVWCLKVLTASPPSIFSSSVLSTAEGTVQIFSPRIAGMSEKTNSAVPTEHEQIGIFHGLAERLLILLNERDGAILSMPIGTKREAFRQRDDKHARFSVMMQTVFDISSSYPLEADASRWRTRNFYARSQMIRDERLRSLHLLRATHQ
jgi:hypothetical protein